MAEGSRRDGSPTDPASPTHAVARGFGTIWEFYWSTHERSVDELTEEREQLDRRGTELLIPVLQGLNGPADGDQLLTLAAGLLATIASDLILVAAEPEFVAAHLLRPVRADFEAMLVATGVESWCERAGYPIGGHDGPEGTEIPLEDGVSILRDLHQRFGDGPRPTSGSSLKGFAEVLAESLSLYRQAFSQLSKPLTDAQRFHLDRLAVRCFLTSKLIGAELTRGVDDEPPNLDGGRMMHLTLLLAASMKIMAFTEYPDELNRLPLLREDVEDSIWVNDWIASTIEHT